VANPIEKTQNINNELLRMMTQQQEQINNALLRSSPVQLIDRMDQTDNIINNSIDIQTEPKLIKTEKINSLSINSKLKNNYKQKNYLVVILLIKKLC